MRLIETTIDTTKPSQGQSLLLPDGEHVLLEGGDPARWEEDCHGEQASHPWGHAAQ